jgi:hypothetical protein
MSDTAAGLLTVLDESGESGEPVTDVTPGGGG